MPAILPGLATVLVHGVLMGATYSLLAIGLSFVFGVANIIDFTYAGYVAVASYILFTLLFQAGTAIAVAVSILAVVPIALLMERFFIRALIHSQTQLMMATFGISLLIQYLITAIWGPLISAVPPYFPGFFTILGNAVSVQRFIQLPIAVTAVLAVGAFVRYTKWGKAIIAVSQDRDAAWLVGINVNTTMAMTIALAACLAATASVVSAPSQGISPGMGWSPFLTAFVVVVFGGLGSLRGSVVASYLYGIFLNFVNVFAGPQWSDIAGFLFLITILIVRPSGVFGKHVGS